MARKKFKLIVDDDDDDSDVSDELDGMAVEDPFDPNDADEAAARELFHNPYGNKARKRTRADLQEEATYGIFAQPSDAGLRGRAGGAKGGAKSSTARTDWTKYVMHSQPWWISCPEYR